MSGLAAIILAGGRSTRMGRDKATLRWKGLTAIELVARLAGECGASRIVVSGGDYGFPFVPDPVAHGGPAGGLLATASALPDAERLLVLAVDTPTLTKDDLLPLLEAPSPGAVYAGFPLPLAADRAALPWGLAPSSPLRLLAAEAGLAELPPPPDAVARLRGANTPEELEALWPSLSNL